MGANGKTEAAELIKRCEDVGWQVVRGGNGHYKVDTRKGTFMVPSTPGDSRSVKNSLAEANRYGLEGLEAALIGKREKDRQAKITADRVANDAKLTKIQRTNGTVTTSVNVISEALGYVNGIAISAIAPAKIQTPIMKAPAPLAFAEELLLANDTVVYRCTKLGPSSTSPDRPDDKICHETFQSPTAVRVHISSHTARTLRLAAELQEKETEKMTPKVTAIAPGAVVKSSAQTTSTESSGTTAQLKVELTRGLTALVQAVEKIGAGSIEARNAALKLVDLVQELKTEVIVQDPDPELVRKAQQFDALAATLGSLIK